MQKLTASSEGSVATGRSSRTTTRCGSKLAAHCGPPPLRLPPEVEGRIGVEGRAKPMLLPPKLELRPRRAEDGRRSFLSIDSRNLHKIAAESAEPCAAVR